MNSNILIDIYIFIFLLFYFFFIFKNIGVLGTIYQLRETDVLVLIPTFVVQR